MMITLTKPGKTELRIDTISPNIDNGMRQYPITLMDWNKDLNLTYKYPLLPKSLQFILTRNPPIQKIRNTLMKSSYSYFEFADKAKDKENMRPINKGPHKSHFLSYLIAYSRSPGSMRITYLIFIPTDMIYFF